MLIACPRCRQQFVQPNAVAGCAASCPHCHSPVTIPGTNNPIPIQNPIANNPQGSAPALVLGIISAIVGALALLFCWIPLLGILVIPFAVIGAGIGAVGFFVGLLTRRKAFAMPLTGMGLCVLPILISLLFTAALMSGADDANGEGAGQVTTGNSDSNGPALDNGDSELNPLANIKTPLRTWTNKQGDDLEAALVRLFKMDGVYHGDFQRPNGTVFTYKIGNFSQRDIDLVKQLLEDQ